MHVASFLEERIRERERGMRRVPLLMPYSLRESGAYESLKLPKMVMPGAREVWQV